MIIEKTGLVKHVVANGGSIHPLIIPAKDMTGVGLMNPSIFLDDGVLKVNIRNSNYTLYHAENNKFEHEFGALQYLHAENDVSLTTYNYICTLSDDLTIKDYTKVDTSKLDVPPIWNFIGLEDARLIKWEGLTYLCGVRRDTTTNGVGRMELSVISKDGREISRDRMPAPGADDTYCEKNWMPIIDKPFHFVKWSNPTHVVRYDIQTKKTETVILDQNSSIENIPDLRGGSHVLPYKDTYIALVHQTRLFDFSVTRKNAVYIHRFVVWDKDFNIIKITEPFSFMGAMIEFCTGATFHNGDLIVSFGFQDNAAFLLKIPGNLLEEILK